MKKIIFMLIAVCCTANFFAQTTQQVVDDIFQYIDKTPLTSNIFIDRVIPNAGLQEFNNGSRRDTSNFLHFKQAWSDLYRASYTKNFVSIETFKNQLKAKNYAANVVPIGIISTAFHQSNLGTSTSNANVNYSNGYIRNKAGRIPFIQKQATVIAPLVNAATGNSIRFTTNNMFTLHKTGKRIKTLQLYTNNTSFTLISNYNRKTTDFTTSYATSGIKILRFVVTFNDNTIKTTYGKLHVFTEQDHQAKGATSALKTIVADNDLWFQGYDETQAYRGENEYRIYYNDATKIVDNPIIILDGYDPGDIRKIEVNDIGHQADKSIYELMKYNSKELVKELREKGYDVIIVNHPVYNSGNKTIDGGSDYIERNAYVLISLLRYIKSIQQGNKKMTIIGPSMGGLISRYALAYMEKKLAETGDHTKWNHNTRLWVSFDSPHQGANIPIGVQKGIQYFADVVKNEGAKDFIEKLEQPAPKQMLVNHYTNESSHPKGAPNFRDRFQTALNSLGMPKNLRKVALINGSMSGDLNGISKGHYLNVEATSLLFTIFISGPTRLFADFYHSPNEKNNSEAEVFYARKNIKYSVFGLFTISKTFGKVKKYAQAIPKGSYDVASGGYFNAQQQLAEESRSIDLFQLNFSKANLNDPTHSFIPTKSALAYTGSSVLDENISTKNRVCTGETPFDSYFAPQNNEEHITLSTNNVNWLLKEIEDKAGTPIPITVTGNTIYANKNLCVNKQNTVTFSVRKCNTPKVVSWSTTPNLTIVSTTPYTAAIKVLRSSGTPSFVYATLANGEKLTKQVFLLDKPTLTFPNTSLRDAILAGASPVSYPNVVVKNGERVDFESTLATTVSWRYTRERVFIPKDPPGKETIYDPESLQGNFVPYLSCLPEDLHGNTKEPKSVIGKVPLVSYHFTEDNYRKLPEEVMFPKGHESPLGPEHVLEETPPNKSPKISFDKSGLLEVEVTASNECGCVTETNVYKAVKESTAPIPTPPVKPMVDFTILPNPAQDFGEIRLFRNTSESNPQFFEHIDVSLSITQVNTGKVVYTENFAFANKTEKRSLPIFRLSMGEYIVKITSKYGVVNHKLIVQ